MATPKDHLEIGSLVRVTDSGEKPYIIGAVAEILAFIHKSYGTTNQIVRIWVPQHNCEHELHISYVEKIGS